jgi:hypothetical protein
MLSRNEGRRGALFIIAFPTLRSILCIHRRPSILPNGLFYTSTNIIINNSLTFTISPLCRPAISRTVVRAEPMDYEKEMAKLQKECEERLDDKVAELMSNIETVGQQKK